VKEKKKAYVNKILVRKPGENKPHKLTWKDNIKVELKNKVQNAFMLFRVRVSTRL
jgi:hypothetical protein